MTKGQSYINFHAKDKPNHPIVKALKKMSGDKFMNGYLIYASHWATDAGWTLDGAFIGYTIRESVDQILNHNWCNNRNI